MTRLPKKRARKEADVTPRVVKWFRENYANSVALEIKVGKNRALPHQRAALCAVQDGMFSYKIPDQGARNPFDAFVLYNADAFLVTCIGNKCTALSPDADGLRIDFEI